MGAMVDPDRRATGYEMDLALRDAALHDLGQALGPVQAEKLYRTDTGFHFAIDTLLHAGWWPHSPDAETRREDEESARAAEAAMAAGMSTRADLLTRMGLT